MSARNTSGLPTSSGLLFLRLAGGFAFALILFVHQPIGLNLFLESRWRTGLLLLLCLCSFLILGGLWARPAAFIAAIIWAFAIYSDLHAGRPWFALPIRDCEFIFLFATLALAGPGKFSFGHWLKSLTTTD